MRVKSFLVNPRWSEPEKVTITYPSGNCYRTFLIGWSHEAPIKVVTTALTEKAAIQDVRALAKKEYKIVLPRKKKNRQL
jgi:hypothetical protein